MCSKLDKRSGNTKLNIPILLLAVLVPDTHTVLLSFKLVRTQNFLD